jgi:hypothetical protein
MFIERNKFLTEAMGYESYLGLERYVHPDKPYFEFAEPKKGINFSCWQKFGMLFEWAQKQEWWVDFYYVYSKNADPSEILRHINPDIFADALYMYLKENIFERR